MARRYAEVVEDDEDDDDEEDRAAARDYVMARAAGALASIETAKTSLIEMLSLFVNPDDDSKGKERRELADAALEAASCAVRGIEDLNETLPEADMKMGEPWEEAEDK